MPFLPKKILIHSLIVAFAIAIPYFISITPASKYGLQLSGLLVAVYILSSFLFRKRFLSKGTRILSDIVIFSFAVSLLLFTTGGYSSPIFFLTYFLLFGLSLLSSPVTSIVAALVFAILFFITPRSDFWAEVLQIASLIAIAPLSAIFGNLYIQIVKDEKQINVLKSVSNDFMEEVKSQEKEVESWTEGDFRQKLVKMQNNLGEMLQDSSLDSNKKDKVNDLYKQIYDLFISGMKMKKEVGK